MHGSSKQYIRGFTFVEVLVTIAVVTVIFGALLVTLQFSAKLINTTKVSASALALANERVEYIRSLNYDDVGTVAGIPNGSIPENATTSLNGILFYERVTIQYVDAPEDGVGASDTNGILADYKQARVEYAWMGTNGTSSVFLITNIVPVGIESTAGGGTLIVNVFDAKAEPVTNAEVRIYNDTTTTTIDTVRYTNVNGIAMFAGAPAAANYQLTVTKPGYSTDKTYVATTSNPNPTTLPAAVVESVVSTMSFEIDELSELRVRTIEPSTTGAFEDTFVDMSQSTSSSNVQIASGDLVLSGSAGAYAPSGTLMSVPITPAVVTAWNILTIDATRPENTDARVQVYSVSGTSSTLVPDTDMPGNSAGFVEGSVSLAGLSPTTYPSLALGVTLTSSDVNVTPAVHAWNVAYTISEPPLGTVPFTLTSTKKIGTTASATPIYKYEQSHVTDAGGEVMLTDMEFDLYAVTLDTESYDIAEACSSAPYTLDPGVNETLTLTLMPSQTNTLRIHIVDGNNNPVSGADVTLSRTGFTDTKETSVCGQVFFNTGLVTATDYEIDVTAVGFSNQNVTEIEIDGDDMASVTLFAP